MKVVKDNAMKKLTITNGVLMTLEQAIAMLESSKGDLPFKIWYGLNKTRKGIEKPLSSVNEARQKLLDKYVEKDDKGNYKTETIGQTMQFVFKTPEDREAFDTDINPILEEEVTVEVYEMDLELFEGIETNLREQPLLGILIEYLVK